MAGKAAASRRTPKNANLPLRAGRCARLGGYAMQGDAAKAKAADQEILAIWKDAGPDIPVLAEAKAEYRS